MLFLTCVSCVHFELNSKHQVSKRLFFVRCKYTCLQFTAVCWYEFKKQRRTLSDL